MENPSISYMILVFEFVFKNQYLVHAWCYEKEKNADYNNEENCVI